MLHVISSRVIRIRSRRARRGSALLLVVVLVLLLAMMGTAFLVTVRLNREQITGTGSALIALPEGAIWPGDTYPGLKAKLTTEALPLAQTLAEWTIRESVRPGNPNTAQDYRAPAVASTNEPSVDYVHPGHPHSIFLASRFPERSSNDALLPVWPYISRIAVTTPNWNSNDDTDFPFYTPLANPGNTRNPAVLPTTPLAGLYGNELRENLRPDFYALTYPAVHDPLRQIAGRTRTLPALTSDVPGGTPIIAADADGDGIADSSLIDLTSYAGGDFRAFVNALAPHTTLTPVTPLLVNTPAGNRYVTYWAAIRIVDNAAAVNINTALSSTTDFDFNGAPIANNPYMGAFRANVGFYELFRSGTFAQVVPDPSLDSRFRSNRVSDLADDIDALRLYRSGGNPASATIIDDGGNTRADAVFISQGEALERQLTTRLGNPGYNGDDTTKYRRLTNAAADELLFRSGLYNPFIKTTTTLRDEMPYLMEELSLNYALQPHKRFAYYGAADFDYWFNTIVDSDSTPTGRRAAHFARNDHPQTRVDFPDANFNAKSARHHLVTNSAVSNLVPDFRTAFGALPASVRTSSPATEPNKMPNFTDTPHKASVNTANFGELWRGFWNVFQTAGPGADQLTLANRRGTGGWTEQHQTLTRAALAAVNALTMRNPEIQVVTVSGGTVGLPSGVGPEHARAESRTFTVGSFDVTVYGVRKQPFITEALVEKDNTDTTTFVAIELYNPYNVALNLTNYRFATLTNQTLNSVYTFPAGTQIPAGGFLVLRAGTAPVAGSNPVQFPAIPVPANALDMGTPGLGLFRNEVVLLKPRRDDGQTYSSSAAGNAFNESNVYDLIPADQVNLNPRNSQANQRERFRTMRPMDAAFPFRVVRAGGRGDTALDDMNEDRREAGTLGAINDDSTYTSVAHIPLATFYSELLNPLTGNSNVNRFPFGGFARDGDMLHIPYIGHYRVTPTGNPAQILELNAVTVDAMFAQDARNNDDIEPIGRFASIHMMGDSNINQDAYLWTVNLFSYLTASDNPQDDAIPNVATSRYGTIGLSTSEVDNDGDSATTGNDEARLVAAQGRININTAPWQVLAALPMVPVNPANTRTDTPAKAAYENELLAKAIVAYRTINGPFHSVVSLNLVPANQNNPLGGGGMGNLAFQDAAGNPATNATSLLGDLSPRDGVALAGGLVNDVEEKMLAFTRISNLITTRSDTFTAYILVQAWQDAGTQYPVMLAEKRKVLTIDRSAISRANGRYDEAGQANRVTEADKQEP